MFPTAARSLEYIMASSPASTLASQAYSGPSRHRMTVDEFHRMGEAGILHPEDRTELIHGEVFDVSPIGRLHAALVAGLAAAFHESLGRSVVVWTQNPVRLGLRNEVQPDLVVLAPRADFYATALPEPADVRLIVEVADSSLDHDVTVKIPLYAEHGVPEVWIVEAASRQTHRFRSPVGGTFSERDTVPPDRPLEFAQFRGSLAAILPIAG